MHINDQVWNRDLKMQTRTCLTTAIAFLVALNVVGTSCAFADTADDLKALSGEWIYIEDKTDGRALEQMGPPMSAKFLMRTEEGAVILDGHGSGHRDVRVAIDGSVTEIREPNTISRYSGTWKDGTFEYRVEFERTAENTREGSIRSIHRSFRNTAQGLLVNVRVDPPVVKDSVGLYRQAKDIEMPTPATAVIGDLNWLEGAWVGTRSTGASNEERWSPPRGGAMLAVTRSVNTSGKIFAFEYLRIVERDGGLVYIAQPGGKTPTEFVLTELVNNRAVFENPRHDYPKRIVYELSPNGSLNATIGYTKGGTPRRFEFQREEN
jgi:hypothetical protein